MATNYKKKKNVVKRPYKKRRTNRRRKAILPRPRLSGSGLPPNLPMKMKYSESDNFLVPAYPLNVTAQYNLNSIYDPDRTGTGHQPYFYDQMAGIYTAYKVIGCRVTCAFRGLTNPINAVFRADDNTTLVTNFTLEQERPGASKCLVACAPTRVVRYSRYYHINRILKIPKKEYMDDFQFQVPYGANPPPSQPAILNIMFEQSDHLATPDTILFNLVLEYDVMLLDLTVQAQS